jgi:uncharacterized protein YjbJ (UPF0337 family)
VEVNSMNADVFAGQWKQMRGELKSWWGKLSDYDLDRIEGQKDKLIGLVQEKYGYARAQAEQEVERRFKEWNDKTTGTFTKMTATAQELGASAASKANEAATAVGEKIASAGSYLRDKKVADLAPGVTSVIHAYPLQSLLIGVGVGYLLGLGSWYFTDARGRGGRGGWLEGLWS